MPRILAENGPGGHGDRRARTASGQRRVCQLPLAVGKMILMASGRSSPLEDTTRIAPAPARDDGDEAAYLLVLAGSNLGAMYKVDKERLVMGRGEKVDVRLIDEGLSREHACIVKEGGRFVVEDLASTNGTYCNGGRVTRHALTEGDKILLGSTTILKFTYQDRLDEAFQRQMSESALRDGLTHAYNKRYFGDRLDGELQYAQRHDAPLALVLLDIDHFKAINDRHGHPAGDEVLVQLAALVMSMLRESDLFARYGGEEFAIIAPATDLDAIRPLCERLRAAIEAHPFVHEGTRIPVTASFGVARAPAPGAASSAEFVAAADEALYAAKRGGRNRVCAAGEHPPFASG
jgi:two-component system cell cycle response regulator